MASKIVLIVLIVFLGLVVIVPFVLSVAGIKILQFGSVGGGVGLSGEGLLRSDDLGETWKNAAVSSQKRIYFPKGVLDLAFHPQNPDLIFLGSKSSGLWKSTDGGSSWQKVNDRSRTLDNAGDVYRIAISKAKPEVIYLAVFQNNRGRVLKSEDGGETFREIYFVTLSRFGVFDLHLDFQDPEHLVIVTGQGGVLETKNGGMTWRVKRWFSDPLTRLLVNPYFFNEMLVVTSKSGFFKSFDGGTNWANLKEGLERATSGVAQPSTSGNPFSFGPKHSLETLEADPNNFATVYVGSSGGLFRSQNGGFSWEQLRVLIPPEALPVNAVEIHPRDSRVIFAGAGTQLHRSDDGGVNWSVDILPTKSRIIRLLIHPLRPEVMFAILGR